MAATFGAAGSLPPRSQFHKAKTLAPAIVPDAAPWKYAPGLPDRGGVGGSARRVATAAEMRTMRLTRRLPSPRRLTIRRIEPAA